jgi:hypothetical protein
MRNQLMLGVLLMVFHGVSDAKKIIDLYGDESARAQQVLSQYEKQVILLVERSLKIQADYHEHVPQEVLARLESKRNKLCDRIKKAGHYAYVSFDVVYYPNDKQHYITIEVIKSKDKQRLQWINQSTSFHQQPVGENDIIQVMQAYLEVGYQLVMSNQLNVAEVKCSSFHCLFGFEHPELQPYRNKIDQGVRSGKSLILTTLNQDLDPERRKASVYLIGEFNDAEEILNLLVSHVTDHDDGVRNSVIRVIADTMHRSGIKKIDVRPFIQLLDSPYETDRNKSLFVLLEAADLPEQNQQIRELAISKLLSLAKLRQPNNHAFAVKLLEKLQVG